MPVSDSLPALPNEIVLASAGSGKTYRLSNRVIGLIVRGVEPRAIAALTFTRKAAGEFSDEVLKKLATAARSKESAAKLADQLGLPDLSQRDFTEALARVVDQLPEMFMGTLDSFFARVVRCFQYELGLSGGPFELVQADVMKSLVGDLLEESLKGQSLEEEERQSFFQSFKVATLGRDDARVGSSLSGFVEGWHELLLDHPEKNAWGNALVLFPEGVPTEEALHEKRRGLENALESLLPEDTDMQQMLDVIRGYTVGTGDFGKTGLLAKVLANFDDFQSGSAEVSFGRGKAKLKQFSERTTRTLRDLIVALAEHEAWLKMMQTRAVWHVLSQFEKEYNLQVRSQGRVTFTDLKLKMSNWSRSEGDRLRREQVDFRLDAKYDQWLLDEFQDTSKSQWLGVQSLVDEVVHGEKADRERGFFIVGDRKQGIYGWRGGDSTLFDTVQSRYQGDFEPFSMAQSFRSQPSVLELVNKVFSPGESMKKFFPAAVLDSWQWEEHVSAPQIGDKSAYCCVCEVGKRGEEGRELRLEKLLVWLREVQPLERGLSCGLLFRKKSEAAEVAERLREQGFPVAENGVYFPGRDSPVGRAVVDLLRWLGNPSDQFARVHLLMAKVLERGDEAEWTSCHELAVRRGWDRVITEAFSAFDLSNFGKTRLQRLVELTLEARANGLSTPLEIARYLEGNESPTAEMSEALQVMTIHKSKGLGFDLVFLPELSDRKLDDKGKYSRAVVTKNESAELITQVPSSWARAVLPVFRDAEQAWTEEKLTEDLCLLYVAMTRAKRGLYILMDAPALKSGSVSYAGWLREVLGDADEDGLLFESGKKDWFTDVEFREVEEELEEVKLPRLV